MFYCNGFVMNKRKGLVTTEFTKADRFRHILDWNVFALIEFYRHLFCNFNFHYSI